MRENDVTLGIPKTSYILQHPLRGLRAGLINSYCPVADLGEGGALGASAPPAESMVKIS